MNFISTRIPYRETGYFSGIVMDYLDQAEPLKSFYQYSPRLPGIQKAIEERNKFPVDRKLLVAELKKQYKGIDSPRKVQKNIDSLLSEKNIYHHYGSSTEYFYRAFIFYLQDPSRHKTC